MQTAAVTTGAQTGRSRGHFWVLIGGAGSLRLTVDMGCTVSLTAALTSRPERRPAFYGSDLKLLEDEDRWVWFQGLASAAGSGQAGGVFAAAGWASVENQEDMADLALVNAPPTD